MEQNNLPLISVDLIAHEVAKHLSPAMRFVLSRVNAVLFRMLGKERLLANPLEDFCKNGNLELLKWDQDGPFPSKVSSPAIHNAAQHGHLRILEYIGFTRMHLFDSHAAVIAVQNNHQKIVEFFRTKRVRLEEKAATEAASAGNLAMLKVLFDSGTVFTSRVLNAAAKTQNKEIIEYLLRKGVKFDRGFIKEVALTGNLDLVKWAVSMGAPLLRRDWKVHEAAATAGSLEIMKFAYLEHKVNFSMSTDVVREAIRSGNVELIQWLIDNCRKARKHLLSDYSSNSWYYAMVQGYWHMVQFGIDNGMALIARYYANAIDDDKQEVMANLEWRQCPMDHTALSAALKKSNFTLAQTLLRKGVAWDQAVTVALAKAGLVDVLKWALRQWCPLAETALVEAAANGHLAMVKFLHEDKRQPLTFDALKNSVSIPIKVDLVEYFRSKNFIADDRIWTHFLTTAHVRERTYAKETCAILTHLRAMGMPLRAQMTVDIAKLYHYDILMWLVNQGCPLDMAGIKSSVGSGIGLWKQEAKNDLKRIQDWLARL